LPAVVVPVAAPPRTFRAKAQETAAVAERAFAWESRPEKGGAAMSWRPVRAATLAASTVLVVALAVDAGDSYLAPGFFAGGLTAQSSWEEISAAPSIQAEVPMLNFGATFVPLSAICVDGAMLRIADPRIDNGVRVSVASLPGMPARTGPTGYAATRADRFAAGAGALADVGPPAEPLQRLVSVYKIIPRPLSTERVYLFDKALEIPTCSTR
jgi:hypothetical protein